jgi:dihydrofolate synthase/folylpolyglutamate synthase
MTRSTDCRMDRTDPEYIDAVRYLMDRINYEKAVEVPYDQQSYRLARMTHLLDLLGHPQNAAPVIHIAGTKGKGSVAWLVAETLRRSGLRTGLYTSPHLEHLEERFVVQGQGVAPQQLLAAMPRLREAAERCTQSEHGAPTFFEMTTALAWLLFQNAGTEANVIEVGLGGRLDSTNVCSPVLCIITSISYDHQQQLGHTLDLIAGEKAGIIKPGIPVIHGAKAPEAREVIREVALKRGCELWELERDFNGAVAACPLEIERDAPPRPNLFTFRSRPPLPPSQITELRLRMLGAHQADNASLAVAAYLRLNAAGWNLPGAALADALAETQVPARVEWVAAHPCTVIDAAHNEASIAALLDTLSQSFDAEHRTIIFACSKDKKVAEMLRLIVGFADRLIVTQYRSNPRFVPVERLEYLAREEMAQQLRRIELFSAPDVEMAIEYARRSPRPKDLLCVTGSFFTAAEARSAMRERAAAQTKDTSPAGPSSSASSRS